MDSFYSFNLLQHNSRTTVNPLTKNLKGVPDSRQASRVASPQDPAPELVTSRIVVQVTEYALRLGESRAAML